MDINQVYKAPSIPKLGKRTVSSSVLRGAVASTTATPKLKTTKFSFAKPKISAETLKSEVTPIQVSETLVETNRILVEIQKQLSLDFAMRIAEEKETIKKIKAAESKRKFAAKEASVETTKKIGGALGGAISKVAAPIKNVFDKIKEFFGLILTGIVYNAAFKWLQDDKNKELLFTIFDWIGKLFVPAVIGIVGYKFAKWGIRLFKITRWFWRLPGRLAKILGIKTPGTPGLPKIPQLSNKALSNRNASWAKFIAGQSNFGDRLRLMRRGMIGPGELFTKGGTEALKRTAKKPIESVTTNLTSKVGSKLGGKLAQNTLKAVPFLGSAIAIIEGINRLKDGDVMGAMLSFGTAIPGIGWGFLAADITRAFVGDDKFDNFLGDAFTGQVGMTEEQKKKQMQKSALERSLTTANPFQFAFNNGGTIPGPKVNKDVTPILGTPGEEVVNARSSALWRPLIKMLNDQGGRIWQQFSMAVQKLLETIGYLKEVFKEQQKVVEDNNKYIKEDIEKKRQNASAPSPPNGSYTMNTKPKNLVIMSSVSVPRVLAQQSSGRGTTILPMINNAIKSKPPQIPQMQGKETDPPVISPSNITNPWMEIAPSWYGIQLYV